MKIIFYLMVLTFLAPLIMFGSMLQSALLRLESEWGPLKSEYKYWLSKSLEAKNG